MITLEDAEVFAHRELVAARLDGHDAPPWDLLLARRGVLVAEFGDASPIRGDGTHGTLRGQPVVYVHELLGQRGRAFVALHEYAHHLVEAERLELACPLERFCNRFAASALCPRPTVMRAWRSGRGDLLAAYSCCTTVEGTTFALRLAEVGIAPVRLFELDRERYVEPPETPSLPGLRRVVAAARREGFAEAPGARAWRLPDTPSRVAVLHDLAA